MDEFTQGSTGIITRFQDELKKIRTGRAQPSQIENVMIQVEAYGGARMTLRELAGISAPDSNLLVVQPFDKSVLKDIERSLSLVSAELGSSPIVKDNLIHLVVPSLTQERRLQLAKIVDKQLEETKVSLRNLRGDVKELIESTKGEAGVSEDDITRQIEELQKQVDATMKGVEEIAEKKKKELMQL